MYQIVKLKLTTMRYTVTLDAYIWAENDEQAKDEARNFEAMLNSQLIDDHRVKVQELHRTPFGSLEAKKIELCEK